MLSMFLIVCSPLGCGSAFCLLLSLPSFLTISLSLPLYLSVYMPLSLYIYIYVYNDMDRIHGPLALRYFLNVLAWVTWPGFLVPLSLYFLNVLPWPGLLSPDSWFPCLASCLMFCPGLGYLARIPGCPVLLCS